jgi:hypothetical protein
MREETTQNSYEERERERDRERRLLPWESADA